MWRIMEECGQLACYNLPLFIICVKIGWSLKSKRKYIFALGTLCYKLHWNYQYIYMECIIARARNFRSEMCKVKFYNVVIKGANFLMPIFIVSHYICLWYKLLLCFKNLFIILLKWITFQCYFQINESPITK